MPNIVAKAFSNIIMSKAVANKGAKLSADSVVAIRKAVASTLGTLKPTTGNVNTVDIFLKSMHHGNVKFTAKAMGTDGSIIAKLVGALKKGGDIVFKGE